MITFGARVHALMQSRGPLCVGIDPHPGLLEQWACPTTSLAWNRSHSPRPVPWRQWLLRSSRSPPSSRSSARSRAARGWTKTQLRPSVARRKLRPSEEGCWGPRRLGLRLANREIFHHNDTTNTTEETRSMSRETPAGQSSVGLSTDTNAADRRVRRVVVVQICVPRA